MVLTTRQEDRGIHLVVLATLLGERSTPLRVLPLALDLLHHLKEFALRALGGDQCVETTRLEGVNLDHLVSIVTTMTTQALLLLSHYRVVKRSSNNVLLS